MKSAVAWPGCGVISLRMASHVSRSSKGLGCGGGGVAATGGWIESAQKPCAEPAGAIVRMEMAENKIAGNANSYSVHNMEHDSGIIMNFVFFGEHFLRQNAGK